MTVMPRIPHRRSKSRRSSFVAPTDRSAAVPDALSWREQLDGTSAPKGPAAWTAASVTEADRTVIDAGPYGVIDVAALDPAVDNQQHLGVVWWDKRSFRQEDDDIGTIQTSFVPAPISDHVSLAAASQTPRPPAAAVAPSPTGTHSGWPRTTPLPAGFETADHLVPAPDAPAAGPEPSVPAPRAAHLHASVAVTEPGAAAASPSALSEPFVAPVAPAVAAPAPGDVAMAPPVPASRPAVPEEGQRRSHVRRSRHVALVPPGRSRGARRAETGHHPRRARLRRRRLRRRVIVGVILIVVAFVTTVIIQTAIVTPFTVPSVSMQKTLDTGDRILVDKLAYANDPVHRGDVVVFHDPGGWLEQSSGAQGDGDYLVKRVIGIPGDRVTCCSTGGRVSVNGVELYEPYTVVPDGQPASSTFDVTVPAGELWVLGDNRYDSRDSSKTQDLATKGFVPIADVVGRATVKFWPLNQLSAIGTARETYSTVPDQTCPI